MEPRYWATAIKDARKQLGLTQAELATDTKIPLESLRAYEEGRRRPSRARITALLDALKVDRGTRNNALVSLGYAPDMLSFREQFPELMFTLEEATEEIERFPWPACVLDEWMAVMSANTVAQRLWGVDLRHEFTQPVERNLLSIASNPRFADRCLNWEEAVSTALAGFKWHHRGENDPDAPSPYFAAVVEHFLTGDPKYVGKFGELWQKVKPLKIKQRWSYPIVMQEPEGILRFRVFVTGANEPLGLVFNDWIPLDAGTWLALDQIAKRPQR
jgi:transcriptional regulator with XRE-family HTH domain